MFTVLGALGEFERDLINERTAERRARAMDLFVNREENKISVNDIMKMTGVPRSTI